jgi:polyphosphate kinase 2 (PPK2 family)
MKASVCKRLLARLDEPGKRWKFSTADFTEREQWDKYMAAFEDMIRSTSTDYAPWYVVPADHKDIAWLVVAEAIIAALQELKLDYLRITGKALKELKKMERALKAQGPGRAAK